MTKYFGTDGVRGIANDELTPELAFKLGRIGSYVLTKESEGKPKILVGRDTRISGYMLENALIAGILSTGVEVMTLGVISTPGVAYLTRVMNANGGVMISASHNPVEDNGIKFFGADGYKLTEEQEEEMENLLNEAVDTLPRPTGSNVGSITEYFEGGHKYIQYLKQTVDEDFTGIHVAIDCAHGATSSLATHVFADLEADISTMGASPNGLNINDGVGSTHPEKLAELVKEKEADIGLAFDGDGDRLIAVDEHGEIVDGDKIMFIIGRYLKSKGRLKSDTIVSTIMSNLGFYKALREHEMTSVKTAVGDKYVVEEMRKNNFTLGGEQSGHIVMLDYNTTGDGLLTGLQLVNIMKVTGKKLSELASEMTVYPQELVNVRVTDKHAVTENERVATIIADVEKEMEGNGRVLVRPSGTEPLVRVMVEAPTNEECKQYVDKIVAVVQEEMGLED
ncbi:phosphoglucosamine mutase [Sporosarcina pasteurii]|uniref:Phosphoglucosamine mutase n=1 Tax=Sporosarcina pasteurii TaxID=1474 RepID=A0A380CHP0_SPOPA|nr:phosphoglucosamine mutase [Sporosarcina pasteurii]MDS9472051.1 phosphoglucosamine mutase [Sporosarcina pasteurii]QBQ06779.1 phosphoglucosamine mutase [Sporosarcina pasteurii]SUJ20919.1 Phosphoglucosamine mutase [Sporosarcina pasteurii]